MTAEVLDVIEELRREGRDLILVTHQMAFARRVADHAVFVAEGRVLETSTGTELFENPRSPAARDFLARVLRY
jgi:polar amino acid transport system ATP-binding protein